MAVSWSDRALTEIDRTAERIAHDSARHAEYFVDRIFKVGEIISKNPWIGRVVPEFERDDLREMIVSKNRVIYHVTDSGNVTIITVHYGPIPLDQV